METNNTNTKLSFISNNLFLYKEDEQIYIGFGEKSKPINNSPFYKKLGWDYGTDDWTVANKEMNTIQCTFEECEWSKFAKGDIGFASNLNQIEKGEEKLLNQIDNLDNYFIKCNDNYLVHIIDKDMWNSVSMCKWKNWSSYCRFYKLIK